MMFMGGNPYITEKRRYNYLPIDHIRAEIIGVNADAVRDKVKDKMQTVFNGELVKYEYVIHHGLKVEIWGAKMYLSGSLHKYWNEGKHNANDFTQTGFNEALKKLHSEFGIRPHNLRLTQVEYGLNIETPTPCETILNACFFYKGSEFAKTNDFFKKYIEVEGKQFKIKAYDKGLQNGITGKNLLRVEIKVKRCWEYKLTKNIGTLEDFIKSDKTPYVNDLLTRWNGILFADPSANYSDKWHKYTNIEFWRKQRTKSRQTFKRHRDRLAELNRTTGDNHQRLITNRLIDKLKSLQPITKKRKSTKLQPRPRELIEFKI